MPSLRNQNVGGLDVAMDNAFGVGRIERISDFNSQAKQDFAVRWPARNSVLECHPVQEFHGNKALALVLADFIDRADIGMVQRRCGPRFATKSLQCLRVLGNVLGQEFERNKPPQRRVLGLVDNTHAAAAQLFNNPVVRNGFADHFGGKSMLWAVQQGSQFEGRWEIGSVCGSSTIQNVKQFTQELGVSLA